MKSINFVQASEEDLSELLRLETACFSYPWRKNHFLESFRHSDMVFLVTCENCNIGYSVFRFILDECEILSLGIEPECQSRGYGTQLIEFCMQKARENNCKKLFLEVRVSNLPAQRLYEKIGFKSIGLRKNYYQGSEGREDAIVMGVDCN
tara:strand:+ start:156 stop:605 length:450 start_codon:yes stop_codon:yes gene_type:complete